MTGQEVPIDMVLHTPGGLVLAAEQIASALAAHPTPVTVFVPHYAMSGGTLIAMAADQIVLAPSAVLGPVDPQLGEYPAASIIAAVERKDVNETDDKTLILADVSRKAQVQVREFGLPEPDDLQPEVRALMGLYPQPRGRRPSVEYIPLPYTPQRSGRGFRHAPGAPR